MATFGYFTGTDWMTTGAELDWIVAGYACPGTGAQSVTKVELEVWASSGAKVQVGIYAGSDLIVRTTYKAGPDGAGFSEWAATDLTWEAGYSTLTGGTTYTLVLLSESTSAAPRGTTGAASGTSKYSAASSMPTSLPSGTNYTFGGINIRVTVADASSFVPYPSSSRGARGGLIVPSGGLA